MLPSANMDKKAWRGHYFGIVFTTLLKHRLDKEWVKVHRLNNKGYIRAMLEAEMGAAALIAKIMAENQMDFEAVETSAVLEKTAAEYKRRLEGGLAC